MKIIQKLIGVCLFSFVFAFANEIQLKPRNIHVMLEKDIYEALLEVRGAYYIFNPHDGTKVSSGILGKRFIIRPTESGLKWGQVYPGIHQIVIVPRSDESKILLNGIQYDGAMAIFKVEDKINIVNQVDVESYLKSILNLQFQYPLESEAMAAIAIAARTTAYHQINSNIASFWHVDGKKIRYNGSSLIIPNSVISQAVDATKNLILINPKDNQKLPFAAPWTEHCGGKTAPFHVIFRKEMNSPREGVASPIAALDRKDSRWSYSISTDTFCSLFNVNKVTAIELFQDSTSSKVYAIRVKDGEIQKDINFFSLQSILGKNLIKSNDFVVFLRDNELHFVGYGKGHGVGLCVYSASCMAQNGDTAIKILSKFFPKTYLVNLSSGLVEESAIQK